MIEIYGEIFFVWAVSTDFHLPWSFLRFQIDSRSCHAKQSEARDTYAGESTNVECIYCSTVLSLWKTEWRDCLFAVAERYLLTNLLIKRTRRYFVAWCSRWYLLVKYRFAIWYSLTIDVRKTQGAETITHCKIKAIGVQYVYKMSMCQLYNDLSEMSIQNLY